MKILLLLMGVSLPSIVSAQTLPSKKVLPSNTAQNQSTDIARALQESANARYIILKKPTPVYRQAADTTAGRYALKLLPGTRLYIRKFLPEGCMVTLDYSGGESYYLQAKELKGLSILVLI
jgi:hypothetical protein